MSAGAMQRTESQCGLMICKGSCLGSSTSSK